MIVRSTWDASGPRALISVPRTRTTSVETDPERTVPSVAGIELTVVRCELDRAPETVLVISTTVGGREHPMSGEGNDGAWLIKTIPWTPPPQTSPGSSMNQSEGTEI